MKVLRGGSAETRNNRWVKFDVELDESDLQAEVYKYNLALRELTVIQKYSLLVKLAELLVTIRMETLGVSGEKDSAKLSQEYSDYVTSLPKAED
jgi:hypothetical protein